MTARFENPCAEYRVPWRLAGVDPSTAVLLAFSGGADSCALLDLLYASSRDDGFRLVLAHVNHGIRGDESARDLAFCRARAKEYGLELFVLEADVPALAAESGRGLEEEAREVRYSYFARLMEEQRIPLLVTAHHADDNLETLLFRLCRGTGLHGLGGIAPVRSFAKGMLVRPLLRCARQELLAYCAARELPFVTDSTNADTSYARNRIRASVTPVLETLFDNLQRRVAETAEDLREDERYLTGEAQAFLLHHASAKGISVVELRRLSPAICHRVLRLQCARIAGIDLQRIHVKALCHLVGEEKETGAQIALPGGYRAAREFGMLQILSDAPHAPIPYCLPLTVGEVLLPQGIRVCVEKPEDHRKIHNLSTQTCIIATDFSDIIKNGLYLRSRREGDSILQGGMHKKLRKLYAAAKVPPRWRDALPILCDQNGIVWAPFVGKRDGVLGEGEQYLLRVLLPGEKA